MNLRITERHWQIVRRLTALSFSSALSFPPETGCILLLNRNDHPRARTLLATDVLAPSDGDFADQESGAITFSSRYLRKALILVRERELAGFLTVHTHPGSRRQVGFSTYDDQNDPSLMGNLYDLQPDGIFGSMVLGKESACARLWSADKPYYVNELIIVGEQLKFMSLNGLGDAPPPSASDIFDRSLALTGAGALARISRSRIGIVGLSGTGMLMAELLMRAGAGELLLFEFDPADRTNLGRVLHLRASDAGSAINKALRMAQVIAESGLGTKVTVVPGGDIRDAAVAAELRSCDLLIGCVDRDWPRLILSEVAYQYLIPLIDLGTEIGAANGELQSLDARVSFVGPGRPCLFCSRVITQERIRLESYTPGEQDRVLAMGYSKDIRLKTPAVMDLNMRSASLAGLFARHVFQPFLETPLPHTVRETVTNFSPKAQRFAPAQDCIVCNWPERLGSGDRFRLSTRAPA
jgi:molybdopterin-synthase adenylyltransferase